MATTLQVKNGIIKLPKDFWSRWKDVVVFEPSEDTLVIKRREKPLEKLSDIASRIGSRKISTREIQKEVEAYRKNA